jgi:transposase InsO family protein
VLPDREGHDITVLGAVLSHRMPNGDKKPVGFASRTLSKAEKNYSHLDKEALAIIYGVKKFHQYLHGRRFEIKTDHKPLTHIFNESRATPTMASGRIQRWALTLGAYDYTIQYKEGKNMANADALSRLPLKSSPVEVPRLSELVHLVEHLEFTLISCKQIKLWTDHDTTLSRIRTWVLEGWPDKGSTDDDPDLQPYFRRKNELSSEGGCVLWGNRVVVPVKGRKHALGMLHEAHPGIVRMKALARAYLWWPGMDRDIEQCVKLCNECQSLRKMPPAAPPHPWVRPDRPWSRVHIDYAGPFLGKMFLLAIDAHSKWLEVHATNTSTSTATIELLRKTFASLGLPEVIVSDNATTFTSEEFTEFLNGIRHVRSAPYHPASNGLVERAVQTFKDSMKRLTSGSLETRLSRFLFRYRITPHTSTGTSPSELMWGKRLRSPLDLLVPSKSPSNEELPRPLDNSPTLTRQFYVNDRVYARSYSSGPRWLPGVVVKTKGNVMYEVRLNDDRVVVRHLDQLRSRAALETDMVPSDTSDDQVVDDESRDLPQEPEPAVGNGERESPSTPPLAVPDNAQRTPSVDQSVEPQEPPRDEASSELRRSTRVRQPPLRFEEQSFDS